MYLGHNLFEYEKKLDSFEDLFRFLKSYNKSKIDSEILENIINQILEKINKSNITNISIFGTNDFATNLHEKLNFLNIEVTSYTASKVDTKLFNKLPLYTIDESIARGNKNFLIISFNSYYFIKELILEKFRNNKIKPQIISAFNYS